MIMEPTRPGSTVRAPSADGPDVMRFPSAIEPLPPVDERIVQPDSRAEIIEGKLHLCPPADEPHGSAHLDLAYVLRAHVASGYLGAVDMLTRTSKTSDFAPDASVYPSERDPVTGGRKLEELAFEIVSEQSLSVPTAKARELIRRGVRRVFCLIVKKGQVMEWSGEADEFVPMPEGAVIQGPALVRPLPVQALLDAAARDRAVIQALRARKSPALEEILEEGRAEGREEVLVRFRQALRRLLEARGLGVDTTARERIAACKDPAALERWMDRAATARTCAEVFADE